MVTIILGLCENNCSSRVFQSVGWTKEILNFAGKYSKHTLHFLNNFFAAVELSPFFSFVYTTREMPACIASLAHSLHGISVTYIVQPFVEEL